MKLLRSGAHIIFLIQLSIATESKTAGCALVKPDSAHFTGCIPLESNKSGFSAIAGGWRSYNGEFSSDVKSSRFWLPEDLYPGSSFAFIMYVSCSCSTRQVDKPTGDRSFGYSVRCVKD